MVSTTDKLSFVCNKKLVFGISLAAVVLTDSNCKPWFLWCPSWRTRAESSHPRLLFTSGRAPAGSPSGSHLPQKHHLVELSNLGERIMVLYGFSLCVSAFVDDARFNN